MELYDAMRSQPANRFYKTDPVPLEVFHRAVDNARFGPQGGNRQPVRFLIVTDAAKRARLAEWYWEEWSADPRPRPPTVAPSPRPPATRRQRRP